MEKKGKRKTKVKEWHRGRGGSQTDRLKSEIGEKLKERNSGRNRVIQRKKIDRKRKSVCVCVCVSVFGRERERERENNIKRVREIGMCPIILDGSI
jgi:hypothetical protein